MSTPDGSGRNRSNAWLCFADESGQVLRPPKAQTWSRRGHTPRVTVRGGGSPDPSTRLVTGFAGPTGGVVIKPVPRPATTHARPRPKRIGSCFDNAAAESFWAVLKEEIGTRFWTDRATARAGIFDFIETFYNRRRLRKHIHFGYLTPHETRLRYRQDQALTA
ncbi:IS3 family transposase (plasmid) [Streptomyces sp. NBC_01483]|nr:IS3 family transposase [Streptomyces sp. NBC_01483]